jgi:3-(3-hydroxy-phenyl)propionate hydroxylase
MAIQIGWAMVPRNWFHTYGQIMFFRIVGIIPKLRDYFLGMKFKPIPRFQEGFLLPDGRSPKNTLVGRMLPQPTVRTAVGDERKLDDVMGPGFALLAVGESATSALGSLSAEAWDKLAAVRVSILLDGKPSERRETAAVALDPANVPQRFQEYDGWTLVVRPDRYVAAAFSPGNEAKVEATIQAWLTNS